MAVHDFDGGRARCEQSQRVVLKPLDLDPETTAVDDDKTEVTNLRDVDLRIVHFVDNAKAEREPDARTTERAAHNILRAAGPCWRNARTTWRLA